MVTSITPIIQLNTPRAQFRVGDRSAYVTLEPDAYLDSTTSATQLATPTNQLSAIDYANAPDQSFTYDLNGNRTGSGNVTGADNRLTSNATWDFVYDANGNMTRRTLKSDNSYIEYTYDHRDRLTDVRYRTSAGTLTKRVHFGYDALNRRYLQTVENGSGTILSTVYYVNQGFRKDRGDAGDEIALRLDGTGAVISRYLHGSLVDEVLAEENIGSGGARDVLWAMTDHQGSVRDLARVTAGTASVVNHIVYDAFGKTVSETDAAIAHLYGYTGRELDKETGLQYTRTRYLDLVLARFISQDPKSFAAGDTNLYRYVGNAPSFRNDASGLDWTREEVDFLLTQALGEEIMDVFRHHMPDYLQTPGSVPLKDPTVPLLRHRYDYFPAEWDATKVVNYILSDESGILDWVQSSESNYPKSDPLSSGEARRDQFNPDVFAKARRQAYREAAAEVSELLKSAMEDFPLFGQGAYVTYKIANGELVEYATEKFNNHVVFAQWMLDTARKHPGETLAVGTVAVVVGVNGVKKIRKIADEAPVKRAFELNQRIHAPGMTTPLRGVKLSKGRKDLLDAGFTELSAKESGRITFERVEHINGVGNRKYMIHFDPNDAGGPNWHKYVVDEHGQIYELNDRGYIGAFGTNNPIGRLHIPGRK